VPRPDVVVSLTDPPIIGLVALLVARRSGARFVLLCQDVFPDVAKLLEDFQSETINRLLDWINRFVIRKADCVVVVGETMRARLIEEKGADIQRIKVIHNWVDCSSIVPGPKRNAFALAHGFADEFVVMHSGNIGLSQGLDSVVGAAGKLTAFPDIKVVFVGDGVKKSSLEAQVQTLGLQNVRFLPYQPKEDLKDSFATADVFIVSLKRGLAGYIVPSKLYGILAAGRPYVAAVEEKSEVTAITKKFDCGLLTEPGNPEDLAEKILSLYHDLPLTQRLGSNARQAAFEFDRRVQVRAYYELFQGLVGSRMAISQYRSSLLKRPFDVLLSGLALLISAPVWGPISLGIKLEDGGQIFYAQDRVGRGGRRFRSWKFRSMVPDADRNYGPLQTGENDIRVTRVGKVLRATAMDELPQLWNIFMGDMSFVGPRALLPDEIEVRNSKIGHLGSTSLEEVPGYEERHTVRPGLTGLAQIYAPRDIPRRHKFKYDLLYVKKQTFWLDVKLIALSLWITLRGKWESRSKKF
jgi:lipopolysaccharide/colanic/teichoic acid biosynthesis glycosyltransferase